jgi:Ni,Fe-hydrogenase maturation factor
MIDTTLRELWAIKDSIAKEHGYDMDSLVHYLKEKYQSNVEIMQVYPSPTKESESAMNLRTTAL